MQIPYVCGHVGTCDWISFNLSDDTTELYDLENSYKSLPRQIQIMSDVTVSKLKNTFDTSQLHYKTERNNGHECILSSSIRNIGGFISNCLSQIELKPESSTQLSDNFKDPFINLENSLLSNDEINSTNDYWTNSFEYKKPTDHVNVLSQAKLLLF